MSQQQVIDAVAALKASTNALFTAMNVPISSLRVFATQAAASAEEARLDALRAEDAANGGGTTPASISSNASTRNGTVGATEDLLLGTISNGTPSGVTGTAPPGMAFVLAGQQLRLQGTYTTVVGSPTVYTATVATSNGTVVHALTSSVTAAGTPTLTPSPADAVALTVGTPVDVVLATLSGATLTSVSGTLPAGLSFTTSGLNVKLVGTPTVASASANRTAAVVTSGGNLSLTVPLTVSEVVVGAGTVIADLKFNGTAGDTTVTNDAPAGPDKLVFAMTGAAKLGTGQGVKSGTTCLFPNIGTHDGSNTMSVGDVSLDGDFEMSFWYTRTNSNGSEFGDQIGLDGAVINIGDYFSPSYLSIEISDDNVALVVEETNSGGDTLGTAPGVATLIPPGVKVYGVLNRIGGQMSLALGGTRVIGPVPYAKTVTGKVSLLQSTGSDYAVAYAAMDDFLFTKGAAVHTTFPFTPPA